MLLGVGELKRVQRSLSSRATRARTILGRIAAFSSNKRVTAKNLVITADLTQDVAKLLSEMAYILQDVLE